MRYFGWTNGSDPELYSDTIVRFPEAYSLHSANPNSDLRSWQLLNDLSDEELATDLLAGRHDGLVVLFDRYHKLIFGVALRIVCDPGEAEEVVQTVFLDIFRALANFDREKGTLKVWLMQYAYGRALNRRRHLDANHFYDSLSLDSILESRSLSSRANVAELSRLMEELLAALNPRRRSVIELTYFEGLTADEISERLRIPVGVVRHELYRGLAKLRKAVKKTRQPIRGERKIQGKEALTPDAHAL